MLDGVMGELRKGLPKAGKFRIFANYGTTEYPKGFIQPRSWVPFLESMSVKEEETRLKVGNIDQMSRKEADNVNTGKPSGSAASSDDGDDEDW